MRLPEYAQPAVAAAAPAAPQPAPAASAAPAPALAGIEPPRLIEITDSMAPEEIRRARVANAKAESAYNKALKAAGIDPAAVKAGAATVAAAPAALFSRLSPKLRPQRPLRPRHPLRGWLSRFRQA